MRGLSIFCIALTISLIFAVNGQITVEKLSKTSLTEYEKWVAPYRLRSVEDKLYSVESLSKLIITEVSSERRLRMIKINFF